MGYKKVCLKCRLVFNRPFDPGYGLPYPCPSCQITMKIYPHRFRPPAKTELRKWAVVRFLAEHGFNYQKLLLRRERIPGKGTVECRVSYPETMREAVVRTATQAEKGEEWSLGVRATGFFVPPLTFRLK